MQKSLLLISMVLLGSVPALAGEAGHAPWHPGHYWGAAVQVSVPRGVFKDRFSTGYGVQGVADYPLIPLLDLTGSAGWNHFPGANDGAGADVWEGTLGARFVLGVFFMNGEMGYYSNIDESSFVPGLGVRKDSWEFSLRTKAAGTNTWTSIRLVRFF